MENTIGVIIYDITGKILITKPTNGSIWSFPKGLPDENEDYKSAAIREVLEETSLNLLTIDGEFGNIVYHQKYKNKNKTVHLYEFYSKEQLEGIFKITCNSFFELYGKQFPENEDFKWVSVEEAVLKLHEAQKTILLNKKNG